jgi:hypothetical protein
MEIVLTRDAEGVLESSRHSLAKLDKNSGISRSFTNWFKFSTSKTKPSYNSNTTIVQSTTKLQTTSIIRSSVPSRPSVTEEYLPSQRILEINGFLKEEAQFSKELIETTKIAMDLLQLKGVSMENIIGGLQNLSLIIVTSVRTDSRLEWTLEMETWVNDYHSFLQNIHRNIPYQVTLEDYKHAHSILTLPVMRFQLYRKIYAISYSRNYWEITSDCREYIETYFICEENYADTLEMLPSMFSKAQKLRVLNPLTIKLGMDLFNQLRLISFEHRTVFIINV